MGSWLSLGRCCHAGAQPWRGASFGFDFLLMEFGLVFGTRSSFGLREPLGWTWLSWAQEAWVDGGTQEHLGGHVHGFFPPLEIPS